VEKPHYATHVTHQIQQNLGRMTVTSLVSNGMFCSDRNFRPSLDREDLSGSVMYIKFADDSILQGNNEYQAFTNLQKKTSRALKKERQDFWPPLLGCPFSPCMHVKDPRRLQTKLHRSAASCVAGFQPPSPH
jgi:hypothetical protein